MSSSTQFNISFDEFIAKSMFEKMEEMMGRKLVSFDWALKKLLRSKANFGILEGFLSELLFTDIKIIQVLESEANKDTLEDKFNRVDLKVIDSEKKIIIIEIQYDHQFDFLQRILFGSSKAISEHMNESEPYSEVSKIISINILYFNLGDGKDYIYCGKTKFYGLHNDTELKLSTKQKNAFNIETVSDIYPEYFLLEITNFNDIAKDTLDEWIYFLKNEEIKENFSAKGLNEAKQKLDVLKMNETERKQYEDHQWQLRQGASMYQSHYVDGKIDGEKIGVAKGIIEGRKEEKIQIAKNLLQNNIDISVIELSTGLTKQEIETLQKVETLKNDTK